MKKERVLGVRWGMFCLASPLLLIGNTMAKMQDYELEEFYKESLDEAWGTVMVAGYEYDTSRALYELDPIAYRVGFSDFLATTECNDCNKYLSDCECEE
jgi:hypothetical protein